jgi:hypothetical protein
MAGADGKASVREAVASGLWHLRVMVGATSATLELGLDRESFLHEEL